MLTWLQDCNWPVSRTLIPFLRAIGEPLVPAIQHVLGSNDDVWKYWVLGELVTGGSLSLRRRLAGELRRIVEHPSKGELEEDVQKIAADIVRMASEQ